MIQVVKIHYKDADFTYSDEVVNNAFCWPISSPMFRFKSGQTK